MRLSLCFLLFLIVFIGCNKIENKNFSKFELDKDSAALLVEPDTIYNIELAHRLWTVQDTVSSIVIDAACIRQRNRARADIKKGKLIYYHSNSRLEWKEMAKLLLKYNVEYRDYLHSCLGPPPGFEYNCYEESMWKAIDERIGEKEIDSLWGVAEKEFVLKYPDSIYIKDGIDIRSKYLND